MLPTRILLIDDDATSNFVSKMVIKKIYFDIEIVEITNPLLGLQYIADEYLLLPQPTCLLLDINMPELTGWKFMEQYMLIPDYIRRYFVIHIISSSVNREDMNKAGTNPNVKSYIQKPLSKEAVAKLITEF